MARYWDERARANAAWYVDTSLSYDEPDMARFMATGEEIVRAALDEGPVAPPRQEVAVEIGPGLGRMLVALARRFDTVIGVDISAEMIRRARDIVGPSVELVHGDGVSLHGVDDAVADFVLSFTVLQHIPDPDVVAGYLVEAGRVLRPGGVFAFQWNNEPGHRRWALRRGWLALLQRTGLRPERHGRHAAEFLGSRVPLAKVDAALAAGGLRRVAVQGEGTLYAWAWAVKD